MSKKEVKSVGVLERYVQEKITRVEGARELGISVRGFAKKVKRYKMGGVGGITHKNRGKPSKKRWEHEERAIEIIRADERFADCGPTYIAERLLTDHQIAVNRETLRLALVRHKLRIIKHVGKKHRQRRERRTQRGNLTQIDASRHHWFGPEFSKCTLLGAIDDATSIVERLEFVTSESLLPMLGFATHLFRKNGLPASIYVDRGSVFKVNTNNPDDEKITQFRRAMDELSIEVIHAQSPQAKGRIERTFQTHQDRLIKRPYA